MKLFNRRKNNPAALNNKNMNLGEGSKPLSSNNNPIVVNNVMTETQNMLKNSLSNKGLNPSQINVEDNMRVSQTKFGGFQNVTKFTESNTSTSLIIDKNESRRTRRPPSTSSTKAEPFVIKFPQEQIQKKKNTEILKNLNKGMANDINNKNNNVIENITGLKASNEKKDNNKKPYIESYNKIAEPPKNIFGDEEIEEDYGDFENMDADKDKEKKNENKNDWEDMFGENANFNNVDEERVLQPQKIDKNKSKREQLIERLNDLKNIVLLSDDYIDIVSMDKINNKNDEMNLNDDFKGKENKAVNTDEVIYKDKATATDENVNLNIKESEKNNNDEENNKDSHLPITAYHQGEKEKK
jgi:hypothetical protein